MSDRAFVGWLTVATMVGEAAALVLTTAVSAWVSDAVGVPSSGAERAALYSTMIASGAVEGGAIGLGQWMVLRRRVDVAPAAWIGMTAAGMVCGWTIGMILSGVEPDFAPGSGAMVAAAAGNGALLGLLVGGLQALVCRDRVRRAAALVPANVVGWAAGMVVAERTASAIATEASDLAWVMGTAAGGAGVGLCVGLVVGATLAGLTRTRDGHTATA